MPDKDAVAAALARLANGSPPPADPARHPAPETDQSHTDAPAAVVAEADHAYDRLSTAAAFVAEGGEQRLSRAVADAKRSDDRAGDQTLVERGNDLLAALDRFRVAAADGTETEQWPGGRESRVRNQIGDE